LAIESSLHKLLKNKFKKMRIKLDRNELLDLQISLKKEYLLTNGKGGYCASTILDCHSRKYHGLLVLQVKGTGLIFNLLSKIEVNAVIEGKDFHLSTNKFPGVYYPTGHKYVESFEYNTYPVTRYRIGDTVIVKSVLMPYLSDTVLVRYDVVKSSKNILFKATPLLSYRELNSLAKENLNISPRTYFEKNGFKIDPYPGLPPVYLQTNVKSTFYPSPQWWRNFEYLKERNRGYDYQEDLFMPGIFEFTLKEGDHVVFRASLQPSNEIFDHEWNNEIKRLEQYEKSFSNEPEPLKTLKVHSNAFLVKDKDGNMGIKAGYHWFSERGRDTLIALAGLTLKRGEPQLAKDILKSFISKQNNGVLPNLINQNGTNTYNSVDTSFLLFWSCQQYLSHTNDKSFIEHEILPLLIRIANNVIDQKMPDVWHGDDGLIYSGNENTNFTWMDVMIDGVPVTSRHGAAVEINALWYNAIQFLLKDFNSLLPDNLKNRLTVASEKFENIFEHAFWNEPDQCLYDLFRGFEDRSWFIRPNQLFAIGLPYTCISRENTGKIIETVIKHLVTDFGIRTLSPRNPYYRGEYKGNQRSRDQAYHNGMAGVWFIGIFTDALLKYHGNKEVVKKMFDEMFGKLWTEHLEMYCLNHISELFRPDPPQVAKACVAQAWNEAELIRALEMLK